MIKHRGSAPFGVLGYERVESLTLRSPAGIVHGLLATASAGVLSISLSTSANAQAGPALPAECNPNPAMTGDTILCTTPAGIIAGDIPTTVDDLTVVIGTTGQSVTVQGRVKMSAANGQRLEVINPNSAINAAAGNGADLFVSGGMDDLTIVSQGAISGDQFGIYAFNGGSGSISITTADVTGTNQDGIRAQNGGAYDPTGNSISIDSSAGAVTGGMRGIDARNYGTGTLNITTASVTGETDGINSEASTGETTIALGSTAIITGQTGFGVHASSNGATANITVQGSSGDIIGATDGLHIDTMGADIVVRNINSITGQTGDGIDATSNGGDITINGVNTITGSGEAGIYANARGGGSISIGNTTPVGTVTGATNGIEVLADTGNISISTSGPVTGNGFYGIYAYSSGSGNITINTTGPVQGAVTGIDAHSDGAGSTQVTAVDVTGTDYVGIFAIGGTGGVNVSSTGTVYGAQGGIVTLSDGDITVNANNVTGVGIDGIYANASGPTGNIQINVNDATSDGYGIRALQYSTGITSITAVDVTSNNSDGIYADIDSLGGNLSVTTTGMVNAGNDGIEIRNEGLGTTTVSVAAITAGDDGIEIDTGTNTGAVSVTATGTVLGGEAGIEVYHFGSGSLSINAAEVTGTTNIGIRAQNGRYGYPSGTDVMVTATGTVTGEIAGIAAFNSGSGATTVNAASVTGTGNYSVGITADGSGTDVSVTATGPVIGGSIGISTRNTGSGSTTINAAAVTGTNLDGIAAVAFQNTTDLTIAATGPVTGGSAGIDARNFGTGEISINSAAVTGGARTGIYAQNAATGKGISITATDDVNGVFDGIKAVKQGNGDLDIQATNVTGVAGYVPYKYGYMVMRRLPFVIPTNGITALADGSGDLNVTTTGLVQGDTNGIYASQNGAGAISIVANDATGMGASGIHASNGPRAPGIGEYMVPVGAAGTGTDISVTANGAVTGGLYGIYARNEGTGVTTITLGSSSTVTGQTGTGIQASSTNGDSSITIQGMSGDVVGATDGINISTVGADILVNNLDSVTGQNGDGIDAQSLGGNITVTSVDTILGTGGIGIFGEAGTGNISIQGSGLVGGITGTGPTGFGIALRAGSLTVVGVDGSGIAAGADGDVNIGGTAAIGDVTGQNGTGILAVSGSGSVTVDSSAGTVTGANVGISAINNSSSAISVTTANVTSTGPGSTGIFTLGVGNGGLAIDSTAGAVTGDSAGITAQSLGGGDISVAVDDVTGGTGIITSTTTGITTITLGSTADVTGMTAQGIFASSTGAMANITVQGMSGDVVGATDGLDIDTMGADIVVDNLDSVTGQAGDGIDAASMGGAITVTAVDTILGTGGSGILADSDGGDISIQGSGLVGGITSASGSGLDSGIFADASGGTGGNINIGGMASNGNITATVFGIFASTDGAGDIAIDSSSGTVTGGSEGIRAFTAFGSGSITITTADVAGTNFNGIIANTGVASTGGLTINSVAGTVTGGNYGIYAANGGSGPLSITTADVAGTNQTGIRANNYSTTSTGLTIDTTAGSVTAGRHGINATNNGVGASSISANSVTGTSGDGIRSFNGRNNSGAGTDLTITATGDVSGGQSGIYARNYGTGETTISATNATGDSRYGISASNRDNYGNPFGTNMSITATGDVTGQNGGIRAISSGSGSLNISANNVTSSGNYAVGLFAYQGPNGVANTITVTGTVTGGANATAIGAYNNGSGALSINANNATGYYGIRAFNNSGTDLSITTTGDINSTRQGIYTTNYGSGALNINALNVTASGANYSAIKARSEGTDLTITTGGNISGGAHGIEAHNAGTGAASISATDTAGTNLDGIYTRNSSTISTDLTIISTGAATGGRFGINAQNNGTGTTSVMAVNTNGISGDGIFARTTGSATDLTIISTGTAKGGNIGLSARNGSMGKTTITANDSEGTRFAGILVGTGSNTTELTISSTGTATGGTHGVYAFHRGSGALLITTADVIGSSGNGIFAVNQTMSNGDIDIDSSAGTVMGGTNGIYAHNAGGGALTITAAGVTGGDIGIHAVHSGGSSLVAPAPTPTSSNIEAEAAVVEQSDIGKADNIAAIQSSGNNNADLAQQTGTVVTTAPVALAAASGQSVGRGALILENTAFGSAKLDVSGLSNEAQDGDNMFAEETPHSAGDELAGDQNTGNNALSIDGGSISDGGVEKVALNEDGKPETATDEAGGNDNSVSLAEAPKTVTGDASTDEAGLTITTTGDVAGGNHGIVAVNSGYGQTIINAGGDVVGTTGIGISVVGGTYGDTVSITTGGNVTGGTTGIFADAGTGELLLSIGGNVTGGDNGIVTITERGTQLTVGAGQTITGGTVGIGTMAQGGSAMSNDVLTILGTVNGSIMTFEGDDIVTVADGGLVNGMILLGAGNDVLNWNGDIMGALRGGDDVDTLNFNTGAGLFTNSGGDMDGISEFEIYNFNVGGFALDGLHQGLTETNFNVGDHMLLGTLGSTNVNIATGAGLQVADGATINGSLNNMGSLGINASGLGMFNINGNLTQTADGTLTMDVLNGTNFDSIIVTGDVNLDGALVIRQTDFVLETTTLIDGGTGLNGVFSSVTGLSSGGLLVSQDLVYDLANSDVNLSVTFGNPGDINGLTPNQIAAANNLVSQLISGNLSTDLNNLGLGISLIGDANTLSLALEELHPEVLTGGIEVFRNSQMLFLRSLLDSNGLVFDDGPIETASLGPVAWKKPPSGPKIWGSIQYTDYDQDGARNNINFDTDGFELAAGVSDIEAGIFSLGFALGYAELDTLSNAVGRDQIQTDFFRLGASARVDLNQSNSGLQAHLDTAIGAAFGSNEAIMNIVIPAVGLNGLQTGKADFDSFSIASRLTFDGSGSKEWPVKPHLLVGFDHVSQEGVTFGAGNATALNVVGGDFDRFTFGYGVTLDQNLGERTRLRLAASGIHHSKDTRSLFNSRFTSTNTTAPLFTTVSKRIKDQFLGEASLRHEFGQGWSVSVDGFVEFGDLDGFGGLLKLGKRF